MHALVMNNELKTREVLMTVASLQMVCSIIS